MKNGFLKRVIFVGAALATSLVGPSALAGNTLPELNGAWTHTGLMVRGERVEIRDRDLNVVSVFLETGINHVFTWRNDQPGFCGWRALWSYENGVLSQRVIAMDPRSAASCKDDVTYKIGQEINQPLAIVGGELRLTVVLDEEPAQTLWTRLEEIPDAPAELNSLRAN